MKKILVYGMSENSGGIESVIMNYYRRIDKNRFQFDFIIHDDKIAYEDEIKSFGGKIFNLTPRRNYFVYKKEIKKFFKNNAKNYDAIWVNSCTLSNIDYLKLAKKYGIKLRIIHSHNSRNMGTALTFILHHFNKLIVNKYATDFWSCGELASKWFYNKKIINSSAHKIINNAIDVELFRFNKDIRNSYRKELGIENDFVIGNVGRLHFQKNQEFLIDIFEEIKKVKHNSKLLLIGDGEDKEKLMKIVSQKKLENNVIFLGVRSDISNLMHSIDCFVFPSVFEGLPVALFEAQAAGLKIYASDTISDKSKIDSNLIFLSLSLAPSEWARIIVNNYQEGYDRLKSNDKMLISNYNINGQIADFEKFLEG